MLPTDFVNDSIPDFNGTYVGVDRRLDHRFWVLDRVYLRRNRIIIANIGACLANLVLFYRNWISKRTQTLRFMHLESHLLVDKSFGSLALLLFDL